MDIENTSDKKNNHTHEKMDSKEFGLKGERAAAKFLKNKGYEILNKNWTCPLGEIDIVALHEDVLVFVEVKTRHNIRTGLPEDAVGPKKRKKYESMAAMYLQDNDYVDMAVRFDVIGILVIKSDRALIRHHVNAFGSC